MKTGEYVIEEYLKELSSKAPAPGGGGAAALAGALGVSLAQMVCSLTLGKKRYARYEEDVRAASDEAERLRRVFLELADSDAEAFLPLSAAYSMPRSTEDEKAAREIVMQAALKAAAGVPLLVLERCCEAVPLFEELLEKGSALAVSDVGVGALLVGAAAESACLNVKINTGLMRDEALKDDMNSRAAALAEAVRQKTEAVRRGVNDKVG